MIYEEELSKNNEKKNTDRIYRKRGHVTETKKNGVGGNMIVVGAK